MILVIDVKNVEIKIKKTLKNVKKRDKNNVCKNVKLHGPKHSLILNFHQKTSDQKFL